MGWFVPELESLSDPEFEVLRSRTLLVPKQRMYLPGNSLSKLVAVSFDFDSSREALGGGLDDSLQLLSCILGDTRARLPVQSGEHADRSTSDGLSSIVGLITP
jgi:hypothetical protein